MADNLSKLEPDYTKLTTNLGVRDSYGYLSLNDFFTDIIKQKAGKISLNNTPLKMKNIMIERNNIVSKLDIDFFSVKQCYDMGIPSYNRVAKILGFPTLKK